MSPIHFHSASRIHPVPLTRPFSKGLLMVRIHSLFLSFRLEDPSCAFGAALLQGPTHGADALSFLFFLFRLGGSILRLWRGPSPGASRQLPQKEKSQLSLTLFLDRVSSREADIGHCFFLPPR